MKIIKKNKLNMQEIERLNRFFSIEKEYRERFDKDNQRLNKALLDIKETLLSETQAITPSYLRLYILDRIDEALGSDKE